MTTTYLATLADVGSGIPSGTSFPGSPSTNDLFRRTDLKMIFFYDGTRWLSEQLFTIQPIPYLAGANPGNTGDLQSVLNATNTTSPRWPVPSFQGGSNLWLVDYTVAFAVASGGSALSASHKWVGGLFAMDAAFASTGAIATITIDSGASNAFRRTTVAIGAALAATALVFSITWTKTGTPGTLQTGDSLSYRIIAT